MRLGVLDVGSNTVHLLVVDAHPGARPIPASSHKQELRLAEHLQPDGSIDEAGVLALVEFVAQSQRIAEDLGVEETIAFATSALREAPNGAAVIERVRRDSGLRLELMTGPEESALTFLAVRRWFGWSAGQLLVLDIGGGSLEIGVGQDELPDVAVSLPLGAGRVTRNLLPGDPPDPEQVRVVRREIRAQVAAVVREVARAGAPDRVVGTSKTFRTLARLCGAAASDAGIHVPRALRRSDLSARLPELAAMTAQERVCLPGVSQGRAHQLLAGALVAEAAMELLGVDKLSICPWALREGVILRRLDHIGGVVGG